MFRLAGWSALVVAAVAVAAPASAQTWSASSSYGYGTNSPAQQAIWRNAMNAAVRRQAAGAQGRAHAKARVAAPRSRAAPVQR